MQKVLNDKQRQMVSDNHNLIYSFLNVHNLDMNEVDDWYGVAATGLCYAAISFEEDYGVSFASYAFVCMENEVKKVFVHRENHTIPNILSLDYEMDMLDGVLFGDLIPDDSSYEDLAILCVAIRDALNTLSDRDRYIVEQIMNGSTQRGVGREINLNRTTVCNVFNAFLDKVRRDVGFKIAK